MIMSVNWEHTTVVQDVKIQKGHLFVPANLDMSLLIKSIVEVSLFSTYSNVISILMVCCFVDINECEEGQHGCSHICENTLGSYSCLCFSGFRLSEDRLFCEGS